MTLREVETGRIVVARLEVADTAWKRSIGLLGRKELAPDSGLWLSPCNGVHTLGMCFAMDVLFLDAEGCVLRQVANLRPWRFCGPVRGARTVVELPAGTLAALKLRPGCRYVLA
ncbi:MAG TPA: DUF192 domain-containing protein [Chthonomonadaceae bacterium]|nr:DUF192 domain-containing protein [Chthonomonadaceae bacterium]